MFFFFCVLAGFSPAKMQQIWKELTNGITEDKTTSKDNQDSSATNIMSTKVTGRQTGDQQSSSPRRAQWYDLSVWCCKLIVRTEMILPLSKHQRLVICRHFLSLKLAGEQRFCFGSETSLLIPLGTIYFVLFVCFVFHHQKWFSKGKSLRDNTSQIKSKLFSICF